MKRTHMNFCKECRNAFELKTNLDYCETCRIILGISPDDYQEYETQPEIVSDIKERFLAYGYKSLDTN